MPFELRTDVTLQCSQTSLPSARRVGLSPSTVSTSPSHSGFDRSINRLSSSAER